MWSVSYIRLVLRVECVLKSSGQNRLSVALLSKWLTLRFMSREAKRRTVVSVVGGVVVGVHVPTLPTIIPRDCRTCWDRFDWPSRQSPLGMNACKVRFQKVSRGIAARKNSFTPFSDSGSTPGILSRGKILNPCQPTYAMCRWKGLAFSPSAMPSRKFFLAHCTCFLNLSKAVFPAVSYTHLTLPTN